MSSQIQNAGVPVTAPSKKQPKLFVVGLPRTCTTSIKAALQELGIGPCHHLLDPMFQFERIAKSAALLAEPNKEKRQKMLRELFDGYEAALEMPVSACVDDLVEMYPDAKFILSYRENPDVWLKSYEGMGLDVRGNLYRAIVYFMPGAASSSDLLRNWTRKYNRNFGIPDKPCKELFYFHNNWVREVVPKQKLLEFHPKMGWAPLCKFVGKDISIAGNRPFPRLNEKGYIAKVKHLSMFLGISFYTICSILLYFAVMFMMSLDTSAWSPSNAQSWGISQARNIQSTICSIGLDAGLAQGNASSPMAASAVWSGIGVQKGFAAVR
ncbi:hypothetical protein BU16DRAFT_457607 [Lophium mytilinum]|uniref:P-loop containing nucleoside triphosphate hydrolase protein n=1 Tax=Lophium mytilinum TaxID=390894 RepID=A0A6A6QZD7_9PEZI|nr:hypothetical protein BU16DRAFT_457607 [Lophium mytilinum]